MVEKAPFEVTEHGWGEFDIGVQIHFADPTESPVDISVPLRLYPETGEQLVPKRAVVAERYDELVFNEPSETLRAKLLLANKPGMGWSNHPLAEHWTAYEPAHEAAKLQGLHEKVAATLESTAKRKAELEAEVKALHGEISQLENKMR